MVLGGRTHHGWAADVDVLDHVGRRLARRDGLLEGVEIHDHELKGSEAQLLELRAVVGEAQVSEQARVHGGVQRLHAAVERLGEAGDLCHIDDLVASITDGLRGRACRDHLDARIAEGRGKFEQSRLVTHRDQRTAHRNHIAMLVHAGVVALNCHETGLLRVRARSLGVGGSSGVDRR